MLFFFCLSASGENCGCLDPTGSGGPVRSFLRLDWKSLCMAMFHLFSFHYLTLFFCVLVLSLSHSFGENSSWIVFLEEETNVRMTKLVQVLAKFDKNKVSMYSIPSKPPSISLSLSIRLHLTVSLSQAELIIASVEQFSISLAPAPLQLHWALPAV